MTVAGLCFDDNVGPEGHSDGDVVAHAACDALLSAAGLGDLGQQLRHRPSPSGSVLAGSRFWPRRPGGVRAAGFDIANVAVQLIGNRPKLGARRAEAEADAELQRSARRCRCRRPPPTGWALPARGEGVAALATACWSSAERAPADRSSGHATSAAWLRRRREGVALADRPGAQAGRAPVPGYRAAVVADDVGLPLSVSSPTAT